MAHVNDLGRTPVRSCTYSILLRLVLWCPIRVYAGMWVLLFKLSIFHSIENTCKKYFCGNIWRGGVLEPPKPPSGSAPAITTIRGVGVRGGGGCDHYIIFNWWCIKWPFFVIVVIFNTKINWFSYFKIYAFCPFNVTLSFKTTFIFIPFGEGITIRTVNIVIF